MANEVAVEMNGCWGVESHHFLLLVLPFPCRTTRVKPLLLFCGKHSFTLVRSFGRPLLGFYWTSPFHNFVDPSASWVRVLPLVRLGFLWNHSVAIKWQTPQLIHCISCKLQLAFQATHWKQEYILLFLLCLKPLLISSWAA